eukprot:CAMPEP_0170257768 /NCGR_PEP_ID=MMETSP0116_2-20130129/28749_1 /TAXON_ID=400756 /ORGANISM="Durinskia baltica, Strain CSIRO CS-38" /LENGTH=323 /DNA_ID=CAMNT_0010508801 /DNA_START=24 /DNA_END=992 /DNA_ORIENTATION=-
MAFVRSLFALRRRMVAAAGRWKPSTLVAIMNACLTAAATTFGVGAFYAVAGMAQTGLIDAVIFTWMLSLACPMVTMVQFVAPAGLVTEAIRTSNAELLPTQAIALQAGCNICGIAYGIQIANGAVLFTNLVGVGCQLLFLTVGHFIRQANSEWLRFSLRASAMCNTALVILASLTPLSILGHLITVLNVGLYAAPLAKVGAVLKARNASSLSVSLTVISIMNNALWSLYALMIDDFVVLLPSLLGYMLSIFNVLVILWCKHLLPFDLSFLLALCRGERAAATKGCDEPAKVVEPAKVFAASRCDLAAAKRAEYITVHREPWFG